ncbi:hypothetical protein M406DRAFT_103902 [Cryphonectria parasitica EP155]|uniref:Uncharacterized protein n=1 Tax=Cryphonectria parasitica (strain ATCC 38755 / EP155) TaxID=660469 RepID=A0A9P4XYI1_CRYP1|nr:uncharacterized protein M406DRAFT_103902 [Cryphonectria parasitica EP155]KAF3763659.1 hypothetical protein M406DRAFT_103902 [Cryphonectria parasitica EP155]
MAGHRRPFTCVWENVTVVRGNSVHFLSVCLWIFLSRKDYILSLWVILGGCCCCTARKHGNHDLMTALLMLMAGRMWISVARAILKAGMVGWDGTGTC